MKKYILFLDRLPRRRFQQIGLSNPLGGFKFNVIHYPDHWHHVRQITVGRFRYQPTKLVHGHLFTEHDVMAIKLVDWEIGVYIDAVMCIRDSDVPGLLTCGIVVYPDIRYESSLRQD